MKRTIFAASVLMLGTRAEAVTAAGPCALQPQYLIFFGSNLADPVAPDAGSTILANRANGLLDAIAAGWLGGHSRLLVVGHTDEAETHAAPSLDIARAQAVRSALVQRGVDPASIETSGDAFDTPMVPVPGSELQNRYVTVTAPEAGSRCPMGGQVVR